MSHMPSSERGEARGVHVFVEVSAEGEARRLGREGNGGRHAERGEGQEKTGQRHLPAFFFFFALAVSAESISVGAPCGSMA